MTKWPMTQDLPTIKMRLCAPQSYASLATSHDQHSKVYTAAHPNGLPVGFEVTEKRYKNTFRMILLPTLQSYYIFKLLSSSPPPLYRLFKMFFNRLTVTMVAIAAALVPARAETHTVTFTNNCGYGTPYLRAQNGDVHHNRLVIICLLVSDDEES
ncbi:hypothetical protein WOLCODRAFT_154559 [Wolfiporia cocos MD-104 SS10]|uniref:Uncharacterized protein n=1 Tax=Wolfiporia cocos (strain MD-104) TaxID=742152 RepID=A0A2H3JX16_WOLCO|nr:hypothetical protein WOLCODRAFT_154559 [Wolfiporia cocos MD-104 SS10]